MMASGALNIGYGFGYTVLQSASWFSSEVLSQIVLPAIALSSMPFAAYYGVVLWKKIKGRGTAAPSAATVSMDDVKKAIDQISMQLATQQQSMQQLAQGIAAPPGGAKELTEVEETVRQAHKEVLEFIYSQVNRATADSLGEVLDSMKAQIKDLKSDVGGQIQDLARESKALSETLYSAVNRAARDSLETARIQIGKQIQDLAKSVQPANQQPNEGKASGGTPGDHSNAKLESAAAEMKPPVAVQKAVLPIMASLPQSNYEPSSALPAATAREVAAGLEALESEFLGANLELPALAYKIRSRLHDLESLARSSNGSGKNDAIERLVPVLDEIIRRDLPELVNMCDSAGKNGVFDEGVRKLLEAARLQDTSPRVGERYDPAKHIVVDFEHGDPGVIIRTKARGFDYKQQLLKKPEVVVGM